MKNFPQFPRGLRGQRGFTLIELSIAVLIGLFLLGGLLTIVQDMRRTFGAQNGMSQLQDSERLAMTLITDVVQAAGYYPDPAANTNLTTFPGAAPFPAAGQVISGTHSAAAPGDVINVRFNTTGGDGVINCSGRTNVAGAGVQQIYQNTFSVNAGGNLVCTLNGVAYPLLSGVTNMQILYGVQRNVAAVNNVDTYLPANLMAAADWNAVMCVKVTLTFTNPLFATQPQQPPTFAFTRVINVMNRAGVNTT